MMSWSSPLICKREPIACGSEKVICQEQLAASPVQIDPASVENRSPSIAPDGEAPSADPEAVASPFGFWASARPATAPTSSALSNPKRHQSRESFLQCSLSIVKNSRNTRHTKRIMPCEGMDFGLLEVPARTTSCASRDYTGIAQPEEMGSFISSSVAR